MNERPEAWLKRTFYAMIAVFPVLLTFFTSSDHSRAWFAFYAVVSLLFLLLGALLIVLAVKSKETKLMKTSLIMMGGAAGGVLIGSVLHNVFYALAVLSSGITALKIIFEILHVTMFLLSLIGCPLAFLVGMVGAIVLMKKRAGK